MASNNQYMQDVAKRVPLKSNGSSIRVINEHEGGIMYSKWHPNKKILATGGHGDYYVDVWDYNLINS